MNEADLLILYKAKVVFADQKAYNAETDIKNQEGLRVWIVWERTHVAMIELLSGLVNTPHVCF